MALSIDGLYGVANLPKTPKKVASPKSTKTPVDASDRKFHLMGANRPGGDQALHNIAIE